MASEDDHDGHSLRKDRSSNGDGITEGNDPDSLMKIEDGLAYCSEKLLNLETLLTELAGRSIDFGTLNREDDDTLCESAETAFELDILSGILCVEAKELQSFVLSIRNIVQSTGHNVSHASNLEDYNAEILYKLQDVEESMKKVQDLVADVRKQPVIFERKLGFCRSDACADEAEEIGNGSFQLPSANTKWISLTVDQQRHVLQQLEKSLARELDLEKDLSDSKSYGEDLMMKLHYAEREFYCIEESLELYLGKVFEAENAAELLFGISRELIGKLQVVQLNLTNSILREQDTKSQLQKSMKNCADLEGLLSAKEAGLAESLKEAKDLSTYAESENFSLKKKVTTLEEQLKEYDVQLQLANISVKSSQDQQNTLHLKITQMEEIIDSLRANLSQTSTDAEGLERKCLELSRTNNALREELDFLRSGEAEKTSALESKLNESEAQLEHAKATVEADKEHQNILYATVADMESTIEELKGKVSKAESRAEIAESKCTLLTDANMELSEELGFLRGRVDSLEASLRHVEDTKVANAKEISARTQIITELIMKFALERESLQEQVSALGKKRKLLADKSKRNNTVHKLLSGKGPSNLTDFDFPKSSEEEEAFEQSSTTIAQVKKSVVDENLEKTVSTEDSTVAMTYAETVRTIEAAQLSWTQLSMAVLVILVSVLTFYMYHLESSRT